MTDTLGHPAVPPRRRSEEGYNLVMLIVAITLLNIAVAVVLPAWSYTIRREREEETIFRGLQYAEAIRVFQQRNGRYPTSLEELVKVEPRSIRQLWQDTITEHGEFGLVVEAQSQPQPAPGQPQTPGQPGQPGEPQAVTPPGQQPGGGPGGGFGIGGRQGGANLIKLPRAAPDGSAITTAGPVAIHGVYLDHRGDSLRTFFGQDKYEQWTFVAEMIQPPVTAPDRPLPRVRSDWLGKAFPEGLAPAMGTGPGGGGAMQGGAVPQGKGPQSPFGAPQGPGRERDEGAADDSEQQEDEGDPPSAFPEVLPEDEPPPEPVDVPLEPEFPDEEPMPEEEPLPEDEPPPEEPPFEGLDDEVPADPELDAAPEELPEESAG